MSSFKKPSTETGWIIKSGFNQKARYLLWINPFHYASEIESGIQIKLYDESLHKGLMESFKRFRSPKRMVILEFSRLKGPVEPIIISNQVQIGTEKASLV